MMKTYLEEVDMLETRTTELSKAVNWGYWKLGDAYHEFCLVRTQGINAGRLSAPN